jgi:hypothetical protein
MAGVHLPAYGIFGPAKAFGQRATWGEPAAGRGIDGAGGVSVNFEPPAGFIDLRVGGRNRGKESLGIGMKRLFEERNSAVRLLLSREKRGRIFP